MRCFVLILMWAAAVEAGFAGESGGERLTDLRPEHPRLLATAEDWSRLSERIGRDPLLAKVHERILADARLLLSVPPVKREMVGRRLLGVSRSLVQRVLPLAYAWRTTQEAAFAQRAEEEMLAAAGFSDWNPSHFLDVGEAATAVAIGYDWCYDALSPVAKATIRQALVEKALRPGLDPESPHNRWHRAENNWNQVCFAGLSMAALAIAEDEPELARQTITQARKGIAHGLAPYAPDGVYPEGPSYWVYGTTFQVLLIAALETALGTDWDLPDYHGFLPSVGAFLQATAPSGNFFNFADGGEKGMHEPVVYWFARELRDPGLLLFNLRHLRSSELELAYDARSRFFALTPIWWPEEPVENEAPKLPLVWSGEGANPIGVFRESWTDPAALYLAFKGGAAEINHAHMDAGSFVLELDGVRWAIDLGAQDYQSLESKGIDLWNRAQNSQRWQVYRLNNQSHSTLTIDDHPHRVDGYARIVEFSGNPGSARAVLDLTAVFRGQAASVRRVFAWSEARRVQIEDRLEGLRPGAQVRWQIPTRAAIELEGSSAVLTQEGQRLRISVTGSREVRFAAEPAMPPPDDFNVGNPGVSLLRATFTAPASGELSFVVTIENGRKKDEVE